MLVAAGAGNAEFLHGTIEDVPLPEGHVDAVISNCVVNLSADKPRVLAEAFRVLRPGGRLGVSDVIAAEGADPAVRAEAERLTGCVSGTVTAAQYRDQLLAAGFTQVSITPVADAGGGLCSAVIRAVRPAAPDGVLIRPMRPADAGQVLAVYQSGLDTGQASFETIAPSWEAFDAGKLRLHRHVAADAASGRVLGWTAASPVSGRRVYAGVIEHSVYVDPARHRRGIGGALLGALIASSEDAGVWTVQSGVFPENDGEPAAARAGRVPGGGDTGAARLPSRPLARRAPDRAAQPRRGRRLNLAASQAAARRGASSLTRRPSSSRAASKPSGSPAGTGSGTDQ